MANLIISPGDCELGGTCECGKHLGVIRPNQSLDVLGVLWERHVMLGECPIGPYDPGAH